MSWCHLSYQAERKAEKETHRKSKAGEVLTNQESQFIDRYSYQTPCCSLARMRSRVRQLEHAHM